MITKQKAHYRVRTAKHPVDTSAASKQHGFIVLLTLFLLIGVGFIGAITYIVLLG